MKSTEQKELICLECGARLTPEEKVCVLCGTQVQHEIEEALPEQSDRNSKKERSKKSTSTRAGKDRTANRQGGKNTVFCNQCGYRMTDPVRFCTACGAQLQLTPAKRTPGPKKGPKARKAIKPEPKVDLSRQVMKMIGISAIVVIVLYAVSVRIQGTGRFSSSPASSTSSGQPGIQAGSIEAMSRALALEESIEAEQDAGVRQLQLQELASLYTQAGRLDRAGDAQYTLAEMVNTADAWARTGNSYFDWMVQLDGQERTNFAKKCIDAYLKSLELDPTNLSVRTDMGNAYQYDPDAPGEALRQTEMVLSMNPNHVIANFNRGIMLMNAGRSDEAIVQFEKVVTLAAPGDQLRQRTQQWLDSLR